MKKDECKRLNKSKEAMSVTRKIYFLRLICRCLVFLGCIFLYVYVPQQFTVLKGLNFFKTFSLLHLLWAIWLIDMLQQLIPTKKYIALGSQKHFLVRFRPIKEKINYEALKTYVISTTKAAYKIFLLWGALTLTIGILYCSGVLDEVSILMISVFFYVCDLICVLIWCPFRLIMRNRCCTTCRIFNWDHLMMFSPFLFVHGFYTLSLVLCAIAVWLVWELCVMMYPERFWESSNESLQCSSCTDKLCTQYCRKLRS